jgi:hypothetical protein
VEGGEWQRPLAELTGLLREHADLAAYAYVRRGWAVTEALLGNRLPFDWPYRADYQPRGAGFTHQAFDDVYAPDAFGVQLLGPGYAGRLQDSEAWVAEKAGSEAALLEHVDQAAWFSAPFIPFRQQPQHRGQVPAPAVLAEAREVLAPILYSPGVLDHGGWTDAEGL